MPARSQPSLRAAEAPAGTGWRAVLTGLTGGAGSGSGADSEGVGTAVAAADGPLPATPLALQFELRELIPRTAHRWNGPTSQPAGAKRPARGQGRGSAATGGRGGLGEYSAPSGEYRLGVRPVSRTTKGWARGSLTWTNMPHLLNRLDLDPAQHRWFCQFVALHRAALPPAPGRDIDWVYLDEFGNPLLWQMLGQAAELGIQFVGPTPATTVRVGSRASVGVDVSEAPEGVLVRELLSIDGHEVAIDQARPIGDHGVYAYTLEAPLQIELAPTFHTLSPGQLRMLRPWRPRSTEVVVPRSEVDDFLENFLPTLREDSEVGSVDGSVPLPPPPPPLLVLDATHGAKHTLELAWRWQRRGRTGPTPDLRSLLPADLVPPAWLPGEGQPEAGQGINPGVVPVGVSLSGVDAAEFSAESLPALAQLDGVQVIEHGTRPDYRRLTAEPQLTMTPVPTEKHDWFDLGVSVTVEGKTVPFVPLFRALAAGRRKLLLIDGSYLSLTHPAFAPLAELIEEAAHLAEWETGARVSRHQIALWPEFEDGAEDAPGAVRWRELLAARVAKALGGPAAAGEGAAAAAASTSAAAAAGGAEARGGQVDVPAGVRADLRPYQVEGFRWLASLWRDGLGAILADDMGLGKTLQCLALIQHAVDVMSADGPDGGARRPFLVVAPTSVVANWASEAARFTPDLVVRTVTSTEGAHSGPSVASLAADADIVITSYALLRLDIDAYQAVATGSGPGWAGLILDEAQFVKNPGSQVHLSALELKAPFKLAVTGTPLENSLTELHALFAITAPGLFASARRFTEDYVKPIEADKPGISAGRGGGNAPEVRAATRAERLAKLRRRIHPFMLRRTKELVAPELPAKQEQTLTIELAPEHRALYDLHLQRERRKLFGMLDDLDRNRFTVFRSLTLLRLLALDPALLGDPENDGVPSSKLDALLEQLDDVVAEGHRALIFSQFTGYLQRVRDRLDAAGIESVYLDGSTRHRADVITEFREGTAPVFLISLKAGGFGLNLTEADYVFLLDPWWNPAAEEQAIDRTHRIGQTRNVNVYRLIAADTIEEKVMQLKARKAALFDAVVDDGELFSEALSADDIRGLLD